MSPDTNVVPLRARQTEIDYLTAEVAYWRRMSLRCVILMGVAGVLLFLEAVVR